MQVLRNVRRASLKMIMDQIAVMCEINNCLSYRPGTLLRWTDS